MFVFFCFLLKPFRFKREKAERIVQSSSSKQIQSEMKYDFDEKNERKKK